jgi:hypothetical protein
MSKLTSNILFSALLTIVMNGLDIVYHLATDWAVHLNYVAIKLTVIFAATLLIAQFVGKGKQQGIATSIIGPFMFYIYYVAANPTLNREVFKIDEQFWFFFIHAAFMAIVYIAAFWLHQKHDWKKHASYILLTAVGATALDAIFIMARLKAFGFDEEQEVLYFTFGVLALPLLVYLIAAAVTSWKNTRTTQISTSILAGVVVALATWDILHGIFAAILLFAMYSIIKKYTLEQHVAQGLSKRGWLILAIITGLIGGFYQFVPRKTVRSIAEFLIFNFTIFGYTIRQNDIILVSTLLLVISLVGFYKLYALRAPAKID